MATTTRRDEIVAALAEVFRDYGYEGASMAQFTRATGLGKGSLYHFFPRGKTEMAEAVLTQVDDWFVRNIFVPLESDGDPAAAVKKMFEDVDAYFGSGRRICLVGAFALTHASDAFGQRIARYFDRWTEALTSALRRLQRDEPEVDALLVVAGIQGAIVASAGSGQRETFRMVLQRLEALCFSSWTRLT